MFLPYSPASQNLVGIPCPGLAGERVCASHSPWLPAWLLSGVSVSASQNVFRLAEDVCFSFCDSVSICKDFVILVFVAEDPTPKARNPTTYPLSHPKRRRLNPQSLKAQSPRIPKPKISQNLRSRRMSHSNNSN